MLDRIDSWLEGKTSSALHKLQEEDPSHHGEERNALKNIVSRDNA